MEMTVLAMDVQATADKLRKATSVWKDYAPLSAPTCALIASLNLTVHVASIQAVVVAVVTLFPLINSQVGTERGA